MAKLSGVHAAAQGAPVGVAQPLIAVAWHRRLSSLVLVVGLVAAACSSTGAGSVSDRTSDTLASNTEPPVEAGSAPSDGVPPASFDPDALGWVIVDSAGPAYTVLLGVPSDADSGPYQQTADAIPEIELVEWAAFGSRVVRVVDDVVLRNDHIDAPELADALVETLQARPEVQLAVTWNGGVGVSDSDRSAAVERHEEFLDDPADGGRLPAGSDPLDPVAQLDVVRNTP